FAEAFTEAADQFHLFRDEFGLLADLLIFYLQFASQHREQIATSVGGGLSRRTRAGASLFRVGRHFPTQQFLAQTPREILAFDAKLHRLLNTRLDLASVGVRVIFDDWIDDAADGTR